MTWNRRDWLALTGGLSWLALGRPEGSRADAQSGEAQPALEGLLAPDLVYLNTGSLGPSSRATHDTVVAAARQFELNPVAQGYWSGDTLSTAAARAGAQTAAFLGCAPGEVLFTRGATDAMNTLAQGMVLGAGERVLSTDQEHEGGSLCWRYLARRRGVMVDRIAITHDDDDASILRKLEAALVPATRVLSVSHVLYTTGRLMPVARIAQLARAHRLTCVIDGAQAVGALPVDVKQLGCQAYAASGHKWLRGPKGTGALYISADALEVIRPIQWEDNHDVVSGSSGLGPLPLVIGLAAAIEEATALGLAEIRRRNLELRDHALVQLRAVPTLRVISPSDPALATSIITCALPDGVSGKALIRTLADQHHVQVKAIDHGINAIRLSPHTFNTVPEIDAAIRALGAALG